MLTHEEFKRLSRLLDNLHLCTSVKFALMDENGREVYTSSHRATFCSAVMGEPCGAARCLACDREAVAAVRATRAHRRYVCHAGLYEVAMPVLENDRVIATIVFGQMLDDAPREKQWARVREKCAWHPDRESLYQAFLSLRRISPEQMAACMEIVRACVSEVRLYSLRGANSQDEPARLRAYIAAHYAEQLDSDELARRLHVGKTKLYALCRQRFGMTPMQMVTEARVEAAKELLLSGGEPVKVVAQAVGFPDQNYFAKVFKKTVGQTPTAFRKHQ